jgi:polar amino acid transport system substrate-binding protein
VSASEREREHERQLFQAAKLVSLGTLVSGVAHEINNPNNFIRLNVQNLLEFWPDVREACRRASGDDPECRLHGIPNETAYRMVDSLLNGIEEGSRRIEKLLVNLRDFARGDEGALDESVDLNAVVRSAVMIARSGIYRATEVFAFSEAAGLPPVRGNYHQIEQVVLNLITNACQALPSRERGITVSTDREPGTGGAVLRVEDQGSGIPADILPRITDPFFTTKRGVGGSGLGLAVSSRIVANHGARMEFDSEVGRGTTVTVTFPGTGANA